MEGWGCRVAFGDAPQPEEGGSTPTTHRPVTKAVVVRVDKRSGNVAEVRSVASLPRALDAFKAALILWRIMQSDVAGDNKLLV